MFCVQLLSLDSRIDSRITLQRVTHISTLRTESATMRRALRFISFFVVLVLLCTGPVCARDAEVAVKSTTQTWYEAATQLVVSPWNRIVAFMVSLPELLKNFDLLFGKLQELSKTTIEGFLDIFKSRAYKKAQAHERYTAIDGTVKELTRVRRSIEAACMYPSDTAARSLCVEREMEVTKKLQKARRQRQKWQDKLERLVQTQ